MNEFRRREDPCVLGCKFLLSTLITEFEPTRVCICSSRYFRKGTALNSEARRASPTSTTITTQWRTTTNSTAAT